MYKLAGCTFQLIKLGFSSMSGQKGSLGLYSNCRIRNSGSIVAARFSPATDSDRIDELTGSIHGEFRCPRRPMALAIPERSASIATPSYGIKTDNVPVVGAMTIRATRCRSCAAAALSA